MLLDDQLKAKLFDVMAHNPLVGVALLGRDQRFLYCNRALEEMVGYGVGELEGKKFLEITHPDDVRAGQEMWEKWAQPGEMPRFEKRYLKKSGGVVHVMVTATCLEEQGDDRPFKISLIQDISVAREALDRFKESSYVFQDFSENISNVLWMTDPAKQTMLHVSAAYEEIWGRSRESLYANPISFLEAIHPDDRECVNRALVLQAENGYNIEYRVVRPDGSIRYIRDKAFPVENDSGEVYRICGIAQDITEHVRAQELIEDQHVRMLTSAKLSSIGEMAGNIAHEINTPLATIQLNVEILREMMEEKNWRCESCEHVLKVMENTVARAAKIMKSLRKLSRDSDSEALELINAKSLIGDTVDLCAERIKYHSVELKADVPVDLTFKGFPVQLSQLLLNLLNNAHDAVVESEDRWIRVSIMEEGKDVVIAVENGGPPIPNEVRKRLFTPFFTTKPADKGTGLGLNISAAIARKHQGTLSLDPTSKHTRFVFRFPRIA